MNDRIAAASLADAGPVGDPWTGPLGLPPFAAVRAEHFMPALRVAMAEQLAEIEAIAADPAEPDFANTVAALDRSGRRLDRVNGLLFNLASSETSPALQAVEREAAPLLAGHQSRLYMHAALFARIDALHARRDELGLDEEQQRVLGRFHLDFLRAGARFEPEAQRRYADVMQRLAELTTQFGQNVLSDESGYQLVLRSADELAGLPDFVRAATRQAALERGFGGADDHVVTMSRSHIVPFLTFSSRRDLREQAWCAWTLRGEHDGASDNRGVAAEILQLRGEQARLHGMASYADYALVDSMAGTQEAVRTLLQQVWGPARARALAERDALSALALSRGESARVEPWDWRFLAEKVRQVRFDLDEAAVKAYFPLERMVEAVFDCAQRLFGLSFVARPEIAGYHPDVKVYEVRDVTGATIGSFLHDNYARPTKRSGAWMSVYRSQSRNAGACFGDPVLPIVVNNNNFAKGSPGEPTLLSFDDARTLFHEFGHGLHGLLSSVTYERLSGTNVLRDFVELPSQLFEHWLLEPEVLKKHARHHRTGEPIPDALIEKLHLARHFNQGYETVRYAGSALVDLAAHARTERGPIDVVAFERAQLAELGLPEGVGINHRLTHFQHLFSGSGYAAGYYVYLWAEVLEADGYQAFAEAGDPFDRAVAERLRRFIYSSGDSLEPGAAFRAFRGRGPTVEPMLKQRGLVDGVLS